MCRATLKKECRLLGSLGSLRLGSVQCGALSLKVARRRAYSDVENKVVWTKAKDERFSIKSLYKTLESKILGDFPARVIWNSLVPPRVTFFCLGGYVEKVFNFGSYSDETVPFG